jgi:hypothetical protein
MKNLLLILFLFSQILKAHTYYVAPTTATPAGNDAAAGTITAPWATWYKAFDSTLTVAGDTVYFRGGIYMAPAANGTNGRGVRMTYNIGTNAKPICYFAYPADFATGNIPILDLTNVTASAFGSGSFYGLTIESCAYIHVKGLTIRNIWGNDLPTDQCFAFRTISSIHTTIEQCVAYNTRNRGFQAAYGDTTYFINCDAYDHCDSLNSVDPGNDGYGFYSSDPIGYYTDNTFFRGCRAWNCGDDGFTTGSNGFSYVDSCWSFNNGMLLGEGHGYKLGWIEVDGHAAVLNQKYTHCLAVYNRATGFTTNDGDNSEFCGSMEIYNNTAYHNGYYPTRYPGAAAHGFAVYNTMDATDAHELARVFRNNLSYDNEDGAIMTQTGGLYTHSNNSWDASVTVTDADFQDLDSATAIVIMKGPRQAGGWLPDLGNFLKLASGSDCRDAGVDVSLPFTGSAPDLGAYEYIAQDPPVEAIVITSTKPFYLCGSQAKGGGNITDNGGSAITNKGVCWSTSINPTTANSKTDDGTGSGEFESVMTDLVAGTTYYIRAYATNSVETAYGDNEVFVFGVYTKYAFSGENTVMVQTKHAVIQGGEETDCPAPAYGDEMITNPGFANSTGWDVETGWSIGSGVCTYSDVNGGAELDQNNGTMVSPIVINTTYRLTFDIGIAGVGAYAQFKITSHGAVVTYVATDTYANGTNVIEFTTLDNVSIGGLCFTGYTASTASFTIDNISLKKVL